VADVLLTHSYHLPYDRKQAVKLQPYPPLATLYAAALLRARGVEVGVFDAMLQDPIEGLKEALRSHRPKIVAIYEDDFNFLTKMCLTRMREVAWQMIQQAREHGARVVVHGSDASDHTGEYLRREANFVLVGPAEQALLHLVQELLAGGAPEAIPGVVSLRTGDGLHFPRDWAAHGAADFSQLPLPARDLIDLEPYRETWLSAHGTFSLNMVASRGCPFRCNWCAKPIFGDRFHLRRAEDVAREMQTLEREYGANHIWFADDIFGLNRNWVGKFASEVERLGCATPFKIQARADLMTPGTAQALRRAGCTEVWMGVESGSQKVLDAMDKGLSVEEVVAAREHLKQEGIRACYFLQFGYPCEEWEDIQKTVTMVRETRPDDIGVSFTYPLPNTKFHDLVQEQLGVKRNWTDSEDLCVMFRGAYTDRFYRLIRDALHAEVESWQPYGPSTARISDRQAYVSGLWREIARAEPVSRNAHPTEVRKCAHSSDSVPGSKKDRVSPQGLVPLPEGGARA
jgi:anaerobic magnesium-protoporphyrin IX monomethyl ester cyclase